MAEARSTVDVLRHAEEFGLVKVQRSDGATLWVYTSELENAECDINWGNFRKGRESSAVTGSSDRIASVAAASTSEEAAAQPPSAAPSQQPSAKSHRQAAPASSPPRQQQPKAAAATAAGDVKAGGDGSIAVSEDVFEYKSSEYTGTFRWPSTLPFSKLPPFPEDLSDMLQHVKGWPQYLSFRTVPAEQSLLRSSLKGSTLGSKAEVLSGFRATHSPMDMQLDAIGKGYETIQPHNGVLRVHPSVIDGLSFSLSLITSANRIGFGANKEVKEELVFIVIGAANKTEQNILNNTNYWEEISYRWPHRQIHLYLVGPEIKGRKGHRFKTKRLTPNMRCSAFGGSLLAFFKHHGDAVIKSKENTLIVGFNTGFGSGNQVLLQSWLPDLVELLDRNLTCVFTCANDYSDLRGEFAVWRTVLGAKFLLEPIENQFHCASTFHGEQGKDKDWSCGNSYVYALQGSTGGGLDRRRRTPQGLVRVAKEIATILNNTSGT